MALYTQSIRPYSSYTYGGITQVSYSSLINHFSSNSTTWADITNLSASITPQSTSSRILVQFSLGRATTDRHDLDYACGLRVLRGSTIADFNGVSGSNRERLCGTIQGLAYNDDHSIGPWTFGGIDHPNTTSSVTYKVQAMCQSSSVPLHLNTSINNNNSTQIYYGTARSTIIVMELGG
jgi:hypothetical protein